MNFLKKDQMIKWLEKTYRDVSNYDDDESNCIKLSAEDLKEFKGMIIYNYYSMDHINYDLGVLNVWEKELNKRGWYSEWQNAGLIQLCKID